VRFRDWLIVSAITLGSFAACVPVAFLAAAVGPPWGWGVAVAGALALFPVVVRAVTWAYDPERRWNR
jgi:hypothetical protein